MKVVKPLSRISLLIILSSVVVLLVSRLVALFYSNSKIYTDQNVPENPIAIVFGAGLLRDGTPTPVLRDRVKTAADLYFSGKVGKLLMSGDNRFSEYNEPGAMRAYALSLGVPGEDIVLDYAGRRTYDTCYRARHIFKVQQAILVTQRFHLPRTITTCNLLGLPAVGVSADQRNYRGNLFWTAREIPATVVAFWQVLVTRPLPVMGEPEPIFPYSTN